MDKRTIHRQDMWVLGKCHQCCFALKIIRGNLSFLNFRYPSVNPSYPKLIDLVSFKRVKVNHFYGNPHILWLINGMIYNGR
jgi:hypothetical protein